MNSIAENDKPYWHAIVKVDEIETEVDDIVFTFKKELKCV